MRWAGYIVAVTLFFVARAEAITVHTWIDIEGVRHYSDVPPTATVADREQIVIAEFLADGVDAKDDYYSIVNQWQRLREERRQSDALRLEERWQRTGYSTLQLDMVIRDPKIYTVPVVVETKTYALLPDRELRETLCAPADEGSFNERIRNPAGGLERASTDGI